MVSLAEGTTRVCDPSRAREAHLSHVLFLLLDEGCLSLDREEQRQPDEQRARGRDPRDVARLDEAPLDPAGGRTRGVGERLPRGRRDHVLQGCDPFGVGFLGRVIVVELKVRVGQDRVDVRVTGVARGGRPRVDVVRDFLYSDPGKALVVRCGAERCGESRWTRTSKRAVSFFLSGGAKDRGRLGMTGVEVVPLTLL